MISTPGSDPSVGKVDDVLITAQLASRPCRTPDHEAESRALGLLAREMASNPRGVLQKCAELVMELCHAESAGVSILESGGAGGMLRWQAAAGAFASNLNGRMPRESSPCGTVMERDCVLLFNEAERFFPALRDVEPRIYENLLAPWHVKGEAVGTLWAIKHTPEGRFDAEDARVLQSLARFAAAAFQMTLALDDATAERSASRVNEERHSFLLKLSDALRATPDDSIIDRAVEMLADKLALDLCYVVTVFPEEDRADVIHQLRRRADMPAVPATIRLSDYPQAFVQWQDRTLTSEDMRSDPTLTQTDRQNVAAMGFGALVAAPVRRGPGNPVWIIVAVMAQPRRWTAAEIALIEETAERTWSAVERARVAAALRESEEGIRAILESALDYAIFSTDPQGIIATWSPGAEAVFGWAADEAVGESAAMTFVPEDRAQGVPEKELAEAAEKGFAPNVRWHQRKDGRRVFIEGSTRPIAGPDGRPRGFLKIGQDLTDRKRWDERLQQSEERLRSAVEVGRLGLWDWDVVTGEVHWSDEHFRMEGYSVGEVVPSYENWAARIHPDDRPGTEAALQRAMDRREEFSREFRAVHPDGSAHWLSGRGKFFYDDGGRPIRMVGAMVETTERREWEDRQQVLIGELQHRTRNLMGIVRSMLDKTARSSIDLADFRERFTDRLEALSRVQGLLSRLSDHDRVAFDILIETEFAAMGSGTDRVRLDGPKGVRLRSSTVQTLAMALHELATNAAKYGALGQAGAQLVVTWRVQDDDAQGGPWLHIDWRESGVKMPSPASKPSGSGQGRELIEKALPYQLGAKTSYKAGPDGVHCTISIPVSATTAADGAAHI